VHQAIIIGQHNAVNPAQFGALQKTFFHVAVGAEAEESNFAFAFCFFSPGPGGVVHFADTADAMGEEQIDIIRIHPI
jgi:hypothetical protein